MNTKEAISWLNANKYLTKHKEVITLLENGEKYKQIIEDVKQYIIDRQTIEEDFATNGNEIIDLINWLKRKYFPKPEKKKFNINNRSDIEKDVDNLIANYMNMRFGKERLRKLIISMMALFEEDTK